MTTGFFYAIYVLMCIVFAFMLYTFTTIQSINEYFLISLHINDAILLSDLKAWHKNGQFFTTLQFLVEV
jgi:hypothetical protein